MAKHDGNSTELAELKKRLDVLRAEIGALTKSEASIESQIMAALPVYEDQEKDSYNFAQDKHRQIKVKHQVKAGDQISLRVLSEEKSEVIRSRIEMETACHLLEAKIAVLEESRSEGTEKVEVRVAQKKYDKIWFERINEQRTNNMKLEATIALVFNQFSKENPGVQASPDGFKRQYHKWQSDSLRTKKE